MLIDDYYTLTPALPSFDCYRISILSLSLSVAAFVANQSFSGNYAERKWMSLQEESFRIIAPIIFSNSNFLLLSFNIPSFLSCSVQNWSGRYSNELFIFSVLSRSKSRGWVWKGTICWLDYRFCCNMASYDPLIIFALCKREIMLPRIHVNSIGMLELPIPLQLFFHAHSALIKCCIFTKLLSSAEWEECA